jgi:hemolysin III
MGMETYHPKEEKLNVVSHGVGLILSALALLSLVIRAIEYGNVWHIVSFSIFGFSLILLYTASTLYHSAKEGKLRTRLNIFDHASIYILIAGTYTPFTLITLQGPVGWTIFANVWGLALTGIIFKLFYTGRYNFISTIMYVFIGSIIVFAINPLMDNLPFGGLIWLILGGISYILGAILFSIKKIKFNHAIFHMLVLLGSFCHFISVFFYVLPTF